jgi:A/G-specific adenine glycosylase
MFMSIKTEPNRSKKRKYDSSDGQEDQMLSVHVTHDIEDLTTETKKPNGAESRKTTAQNIAKIEVTVDHGEEYHHLSKEDVIFIQTRLLHWYDENQRLLPWRLPSEPYLKNHPKEDYSGTLQSLLSIVDDEARQQQHAYLVLVSEIMLQQTQVHTVVDYFRRWIQEFPTIKELACASQERINELWSGLGYYRRARLLHECAKTIQEKHGGKIPNNSKDLMKLPGIGKYTAGAIASIAFGEPAPIVDGNVIRVLSRLRAIRADTKNSVVQKLYWKLARSLVQSPVVQRPGDFNQALMEFGSLVCTQRQPSCSTCPIRSKCLAYQEVTATKKEETLKSSHFGEGKRCTICVRSDPVTCVTEYPFKVSHNKIENINKILLCVELFVLRLRRKNRAKVYMRCV